VFVELEELDLFRWSGAGGGEFFEGAGGVCGYHLDEGWGERCTTAGYVYFAYIQESDMSIELIIGANEGIGVTKEDYPPNGWPSFAKAAAETKKGSAESKPNILVDGSHVDTARRTRGMKKKRDQYSSLSRCAVK